MRHNLSKGACLRHCAGTTTNMLVHAPGTRIPWLRLSPAATISPASRRSMPSSYSCSHAMVSHAISTVAISCHQPITGPGGSDLAAFIRQPVSNKECEALLFAWCQATSLVPRMHRCDVTNGTPQVEAILTTIQTCGLHATIRSPALSTATCKRRRAPARAHWITFPELCVESDGSGPIRRAPVPDPGASMSSWCMDG